MLSRPLTRYVKLWAAHVPARNAGNVVSATDFKGNRQSAISACIMAHAPRVANPWWWGKQFRHSRCTRNAQFYVSGKGPMYIVSIKPALIFWGGRYQYSRYDIDLVFLVHSGQRCWRTSSNYWNGSIHNMNQFSKDLYVDKHCYNIISRGYNNNVFVCLHDLRWPVVNIKY